MNKLAISLFSLLLTLGAWAPTASGQAPDPQTARDEISGMYTFMQDGEFLQITLEDPTNAAVAHGKPAFSTAKPGNVSGFVSRFGTLPSDEGSFLDQFLKQGTLDGNKLNFTTEVVHGVFYEFHGTIEHGPGKAPGDEAFHVLKGTLVEHTTDREGRATARAHEVEFKSFPRDRVSEHPKRD
jgi:hypothetical protein